MRRRMHMALLVAVTAVVAALVVPGYARAGGPSPMTGAVLATVNRTSDGAGHCQNGNVPESCNVYDVKQSVWLNTGGSGSHTLEDGIYFFAVLAPGAQLDPNDGTPNNLSDDFDPHTNRMFTVINGAIFSYTGTHLFGIDTQNNNEHEIRLFPYADTTSANGVYILAVCFLGESASNLTYPVDPGNCEYDAFKVGPPDPTPPTCTASVTTSGGQQMISITVQDLESGIETIVPTSVNATAVLPTWSVGTPDSLVVTGTRTDTSQPGSITLVVTNVAGLSSTCTANAPVTADQSPPTCVLTATVTGPEVHSGHGAGRAERRLERHPHREQRERLLYLHAGYDFGLRRRRNQDHRDQGLVPRALRDKRRRPRHGLRSDHPRLQGAAHAPSALSTELPAHSNGVIS